MHLKNISKSGSGIANSGHRYLTIIVINYVKAPPQGTKIKDCEISLENIEKAYMVKKI